MSILHLSYDYSEKKNAAKTTAVADLVEHTSKFIDTTVISIDRIVNYKNEASQLIRPGYIELKSFGLPYGIFLKNHLERTARAIKTCSDKGMFNLSDVKVIHGHKLTFEGYIGYLLAKKFNKRLFISLRQTDFVIFKYRPDLMHAYKKAMEYAHKIFCIVPSMAEEVKSFTGEEFFNLHVKHKLVLLPNRIVRKNTSFAKLPQKRLLMTALRMERRSVKRKGIKLLLQALSAIKSENVKLQIIGDGSYMPKIKKWVEKYKLQDNVEFLGQIDNSDMDSYYKGCEAFVLPSASETFGLVYGESLLNGTPILYVKNTGFDGFFDNVGYAADPNSVESIAKGIMDIINNSDKYRKNINHLLRNGAFKIFSPEYSAKIYSECLMDIKEIREELNVSTKAN